MEEEGPKRRRIGAGEDAQMEEFYAILRRIRLASKLTRPTPTPTPTPVKSPPAAWNPSFAPEDFQLSKDERENNSTNSATEVQSGDRAPAVAARRLLLDLNQHPEPDALLPSTTA